LKYINILKGYIESDFDSEFVSNNYKLVHDSSKSTNSVYNIDFDYIDIQPDYKCSIENITKVYESKYDIYVESFHYYVISKSKIKNYTITNVDISNLIYKGNKAQKH